MRVLIGTIIFLFLSSTVRAYTCEDFNFAYEWMHGIVLMKAKKAMKEFNNQCFVDNTQFYINQIHKYCLMNLSLSGSKKLATFDLIQVCKKNDKRNR